MTQPSLILTGSRSVVAKGKVSGRVFNMGRRGLFLTESDEPLFMRIKEGQSSDGHGEQESKMNGFAFLFPLVRDIPTLLSSKSSPTTAPVLTPPPSPRSPNLNTINQPIVPKPLDSTSAYCCIAATFQTPSAMPRGQTAAKNQRELDKQLDEYRLPQSGKGGASAAAREEQPGSPATLVEGGGDDNSRVTTIREPGGSEAVDRAAQVSLSPEPDLPGPPVTAVKNEPEDDDDPMEVDE